MVYLIEAGWERYEELEKAAERHTKGAMQANGLGLGLGLGFPNPNPNPNPKQANGLGLGLGLGFQH